MTNQTKKPTEFRLLMSPLTSTVYAGRVKVLPNGVFERSGVRHDVTSDFLALILQYVGIDKTVTLNENGVPTYEVSVKKIG